MLFYYFSYSFYAGIIILVIGSLINYFSAILTGKRESDVMEKKDTRMRRVTELLNIRTIKMNAWTSLFEKRVDESRNLELRSMIKKYLVSGYTFLLMFLTQPMLILAVFSALIFHGLPMTVAEAYSALNILNLLKSPMRWLPFFMG